MKLSLIFGVVHMTFGVMLSLWNKMASRAYHEILLEFIPQLVLLIFIFGYLIVMIFVKWVLYGPRPLDYLDDVTKHVEDPFNEHCAPNLLITFINMMLFTDAEHDENMDHCVYNGMYTEIYMYPGKEQTFDKF